MAVVCVLLLVYCSCYFQFLFFSSFFLVFLLFIFLSVVPVEVFMFMCWYHGYGSMFIVYCSGVKLKKLPGFFSLVSVEYRLFYFIAKGLVQWLGLVLRVDG